MQKVIMSICRVFKQFFICVSQRYPVAPVCCGLCFLLKLGFINGGHEGLTPWGGVYHKASVFWEASISFQRSTSFCKCSFQSRPTFMQTSGLPQTHWLTRMGCSNITADNSISSCAMSTAVMWKVTMFQELPRPVDTKQLQPSRVLAR